MVKCQTQNRNFCAPDGKNAALFFDLDGTIVVCQPYFDEAGDAFAHFMANRGFDREEARTAARDFNQKFLHEHGFEREVFNKAMVECYRHMVKSKRRRISAEEQLHDERIVYAIGTFPFFRAPHVFPNASPVIGRAKHSFLLFAVSAGNREAQKYKVRQAGLDPVFDEIIITSRDDKAEIVAQVMADWNISPEYSAFVGNSKRTDGACLAVTNFVYLPMELGTAFDQTRPLPESTFELFTVKDWRECEEKAINRLLRRRKSFNPSEENGHKKGCQCKK